MNNHVNKGLPVVVPLLKRLPECKNPSQIIFLFKKIINALRVEERERNLFYLCRGAQKISMYLDHDDLEVSEHAFYILAYAAEQHEKVKKWLTTGATFSRLSQAIAGQQCTSGSLNSALFLLAVITVDNKLAHQLVRESGCLSKLLHLFLLEAQASLNMDWVSGAVGPVLQKWSVLCTALNLSINPSLSPTNQEEARIILPQAVGLLSFWNNQSVYSNYLMSWVGIVAWLIATIITDNPSNTEQFSWLNGVSVVIRVVKKCEKLGKCCEGVQYKVLCLLDVAVSNNQNNCSVACKLSVVPLLLRVLQTAGSKVVHVALMTLTHLMQGCTSNCHVFVNERGPDVVAGITQHLDGDSPIVKAAHFLLSYYVEENSAQPPWCIPHGALGGSSGGQASPEVSVESSEHPGQLSHAEANTGRVNRGSIVSLGCLVSGMDCASAKRNTSINCTMHLCSCACEGSVRERKGCNVDGETEMSVVGDTSGYSSKFFKHLKFVCRKLFSNVKSSPVDGQLVEGVTETSAVGNVNATYVHRHCEDCNSQQGFVYQRSVGIQTTPSTALKYKKSDVAVDEMNKFGSKKEMLPPSTGCKTVMSSVRDGSCERTSGTKVSPSVEYNMWKSSISTNWTSTPITKGCPPVLATTPSTWDKNNISAACSDRRVCVRKFSQAELSYLFRGVELHGPDFRTILRAFSFHPTRTSRELYLKWRSIKKQVL